MAAVTVPFYRWAFNQGGFDCAVESWGFAIMMEHVEKVKCPVCEGRGELLRSELAERFTNSELRKRLDARIAEILETSELAGVGPRNRDFEKEVHTWNPTLPMWQRSPKE